MPASPKPAANSNPVRLTHRYHVPPQRVFDAWLDKDLAGLWLFATENGEMQKVEIDPATGGGFTIIERRNGEDAGHYGTYVEIARPRRLVFDFTVDGAEDKPTRVRIDVTPVGVGTDCELTLTHEDVPPEYRQRTETGWEYMLKRLEKVLE